MLDCLQNALRDDIGELCNVANASVSPIDVICRGRWWVGGWVLGRSAADGGCLRVMVLVAVTDVIAVVYLHKPYAMK